jgi:hypothetical protein
METVRSKRCSRPLRCRGERRRRFWASLFGATLVATGPSVAGGADRDGGPAAWGRVLEQVVDRGRVNYGALQKGPIRATLDRYLGWVAKTSVPDERDRRIAFLVDAYNALVVRSVVEHGTPKSVLEVDAFFSAPEHTVAGRKVSLDQLEKEWLNPYAKDPRTHFVLVCGAVGCPILESRPYSGSDLEDRLERATRRYLESPHGARVAPGVLTLSKIFEWYASDFSGMEGVKRFVTRRLSARARKRLSDPFEVRFMEYDWNLNRQP